MVAARGLARRVAGLTAALRARQQGVHFARYASAPRSLHVLANGVHEFSQTGAKVGATAVLNQRLQARSFAAAAALPSHQILPMPSLSPTMTEGSISEWKKNVGDKVSAGDILCDIQTDKATMEMESMEDGYLAKILVPAGDGMIAVGKPVAVIVDSAEDIAAFSDFVASEDAPAAAPAAEAARALTERPDLRATVNQGTPLRTSRAPSNVEVAVVDPNSSMVTVRDALNKAMEEEMTKDEKIFVMGEEVGEYQGAYKITRGLLQKFGPKRVYDTPITEAGFCGIGVGAGFSGLKPIVEFMTWNFAMQAIDQIINSAGKTLYMSSGTISCPIVFRGPNGAAAGVGAQHSQCFAAWYMSVPGLKVLAPYSAEDAKGLLKSAIRDPDPVIFLENELLYGQEFPMSQASQSDEFVVPIGKAKLERVGEDVTLIAFSKMVGYCLDAAEELAAEGVSAEVINLRSLRPLDKDAIIESVKKTSRVVVVEEGWPTCGVGAEICTIISEEAFDYLDAPPERVTGVDIPMPYAINLEKAALPQINDVVRVAKRACYRSV